MFIGFVWLVLCSILAWAVCARAWRSRGNTWAEIGVTLVGLTAILCACNWKVETDATRQRRLVQNSLLGYARKMAQRTSFMGHYRLPTGAPADNPVYQRLLEAQRRWLRSYPDAASVYTVRPNDHGGLTFVVCAEADLDQNGKIEGDRELLVPNGEDYDDFSPEFRQALKEGVGFSKEPSTDKWGTWITAAAAVRDLQGHVDAILGVDFPAETWIASQQGARAADTCASVFFVLLYLVMCSGLLQHFSRRRISSMAGQDARTALRIADQTMEVAELWAIEAETEPSQTDAA